jgi:hypothetical protein
MPVTCTFNLERRVHVHLYNSMVAHGSQGQGNLPQNVVCKMHACVHVLVYMHR